MDVDVIVTTYGEEWFERGEAASRDAEEQTRVFHFHCRSHEGSLGSLRNAAVWKFDPQEWLCFLDADDILEPGYIEAMKEANSPDGRKWAYLMAPALRHGARGSAKVLDDRDMMMLNPCPVGTLIHRKMFDVVGGFWDERAWEDWSLFRRCVLAGAELVFVPDAVYRDNSTRGGRNSTIVHPKRLHAEIVESHLKWMEL